MCASCGILHNPIWFGYLLLMENIHQFWVAVLVRESTYARLWRLDLIEILSRFPYVHTDSYIVSTILQSVRWWMFRVGIPHTTGHIHVLGSCSHHTIWVAVRSSDELLSLLTPETSFGQVAPFIWDKDPANTMAYDTVIDIDSQEKWFESLSQPHFSVSGVMTDVLHRSCS